MRPGQAAPEFLWVRHDGPARGLRFNEAGAGCPGIPRPIVIVEGEKTLASMRPGQAAPEFLDLAAAACRSGLQLQ